MIDNQTDLLDGDFIIRLTIDGSEYEEVELKVQDPNKTLRELVESIVNVFELPKMDGGGNPVQYLLGLDDDEHTILDYEDEYGREQILEDYNVQSGDLLHLISVPIAG
ncbi:MAG: hypothetical protein J6S96_09300 [Muribaculaceae bacterium]|nr:hypothetical protein [Muribaculaceae bacterium]